MIFKTLDRLVLKSFLGSYIFSFFVAEFVLVMQFLWKYIDELVGKGLSFLFLIELVFYYAVTIIPMAVPITILISSVMVYGNMAEKYEISSFKSAGISLLRMMRPGILLALFTFSFSLLASNYLKPKANLKFYQSFENVRRQKPSLTIEQGIFNDDFRGYSIRVGKKDADGESISDIMIYDNSNRNYLNLTIAKSGKMFTEKDGKYFIMELENGEQFRELINSDPQKRNDGTTFLRTEFETWKKVFDMGEFEFSERTSGLTRRKYDLYNSIQLLNGIDTIDRELVKISFKNKYDFGGLPFIYIDSTALKEVEKIEHQIYADKGESMTSTDNESEIIDKNSPSNLEKLTDKLDNIDNIGTYVPPKKKSTNFIDKVYLVDTIQMDTVKSIIELIPQNTISATLFRANNAAQTVHERIKAAINEEFMQDTNKRRYVLRLHQMYSWATICIIFMFIGAPLGSIVRKGGYGYPLLIAIVFFMIFIILMIMGEKLNKSLSISAIFAAWLPCLVLFPISIILSFLALRDVSRFRIDWLYNFIEKFKKEA